MPINVAVVEDQKEIREGLTYLINSSDGYKCVGAFANAEDALQSIPQLNAHVALMDINLPEMDGIACVRQLKPRVPSLQIIMLTVYEDTDRIFEALTAGASGYLLKRTPPAKIMESIADVHRGGSPMSSEIARKVVQSFQKPNSSPNETDQLTAREKEILTHLAKGFTYKEIGDEMFISDETVRSHLRRIYEKLHVHSRTAAVVKFLKK
jgi:DNA-binding NarL/FixJ family response regulator